MKKRITHDHSDDGIDRRGFLHCMAWAGTGVIWTITGGVPTSRAFGKDAHNGKGDFSFVQISDSHIGFNKPANPDVAGTLQATVDKTLQSSGYSESTTLPDGTSSTSTMGPDPRWGIQVPIAKSETEKLGSLTMSISDSRAVSVGTPGNPFSLISQTDEETVNGRTYSSVFTASNKTYVDTTPVGRKVRTVLDSLERIASTQISGLLPVAFNYDSQGRLASLTQGTRTATFSYDSDGRLASLTDPLRLKNSFTYDSDGRLLATALPDGRIITYAHDANGNLTSVTPPGKSVHDFAYTSVNLLSSYTPPAVSGTGDTTYA